MSVSAHADRIVRQIDAVSRRAVAVSPADALENAFGLHVRHQLPEGVRGGGGWCDGVSFLEQGVVMYEPTGTRRDNFTLTHELAHFLIRQDDEALDWVADTDSPDRQLEQLCDAIAARLLIPEDTITGVLAGSPVRAEHVPQLAELTVASWHACQIALTRRLGCEGFTVIAGADSMRVISGSRVGDTRPYGWKNDLIPEGHPAFRVREGGRTAARGLWPFPGGTPR